ncbi:MAG: hypothetical protein C3F07_19680 [Anaerolineales bacterium]|nr:hypothetical protein [Anaerolineae bacterium]PWB69460.1 MAG: hypothetical protein C3F07_19680 [Anaerolineales bacterium]
MESDRALIGALIFILLIVGANIMMYGIVRGAAKGGKSNWMEALRKSLGNTRENASSKSMEELRQKMEDLEGKNKKE